MRFQIVASSIALIAALFLFTKKDSNKVKGGFRNNDELLNIYDEPLKPCGTSSMNSGSWDSEYKCSEKGGGVHQICIKNIAKSAQGFSKKTGQSNWSDTRGNDNHCVCLGAWSLYTAQKNKLSKSVLKCDAIPKIALSSDYVSKFSEGWNKWNGLEINNQIKDGVESMVNICYKGNNTRSQALKKNYCDFASKVGVLKKSKMYKEMCNV